MDAARTLEVRTSHVPRMTSWKRRSILALAIAGATLAAGCTNQSPQITRQGDEPVFLLHDLPSRRGVQFGITGTLGYDQQSGCFVIEVDGQRTVPVWPEDTETFTLRQRHVVQIGPGARAYGEGDLLTEGGDRADLDDLAHLDLPDGCVRDGDAVFLIR